MSNPADGDAVTRRDSVAGADPVAGPIPVTGPDLDLGTVLAALADPHRRTVVTALAADGTDPERTCSSFGLPLSASTRSHHFRVLREAGVLDQVDHGNFSGVRLRRAAIDERFPGLLDLLVAEPGDDVS